MRYKKLCQFIIVIICTVICTVFIQHLYRTQYIHAENDLLQQIKNNRAYPVNEKGQTYGPQYVSSKLQNPDLISATGIDGTSGYVLASDLNTEQPHTPQQALEQQKNRKPRYIPLYDKNGKTVIGKFKIGY